MLFFSFSLFLPPPPALILLVINLSWIFRTSSLYALPCLVLLYHKSPKKKWNEQVPVPALGRLGVWGDGALLLILWGILYFPTWQKPAFWLRLGWGMEMWGWEAHKGYPGLSSLEKTTQSDLKDPHCQSKEVTRSGWSCGQQFSSDERKSSVRTLPSTWLFGPYSPHCVPPFPR